MEFKANNQTNRIHEANLWNPSLSKNCFIDMTQHAWRCRDFYFLRAKNRVRMRHRFIRDKDSSEDASWLRHPSEWLIIIFTARKPSKLRAASKRHVDQNERVLVLSSRQYWLFLIRKESCLSQSSIYSVKAYHIVVSTANQAWLALGVASILYFKAYKIAVPFDACSRELLRCVTWCLTRYNFIILIITYWYC